MDINFELEVNYTLIGNVLFCEMKSKTINDILLEYLYILSFPEPLIRQVVE